ncbi:MAG: DUF1616 domain-containing protein, partial [Euryarchaeota archaeon]|nr:DUF1616 domain-containing protein [Euryarchaeota archaeon]
MGKLSHRDLKIIVFATILCMILCLIPLLNNTFLRIVFILPLILFLPGYSLITALFPRGDLDSFESILLGIVFSLAILPLSSLLFSYFSHGIYQTQLVLGLSILTFIFVSIAYLRRIRQPKRGRFRKRDDGRFQIREKREIRAGGEKLIRPSAVEEEKLDEGVEVDEKGRRFAGYLQIDLIFVGLLAVICLLLLLISPLNKPPLRIIPCLIILFLLPGYSFAAVLYPRFGDIGWIKRLIFSVAFSVLIVVLVISIANYIFQRVSSTYIIIFISIITIIFAIIAILRRIRTPEEKIIRELQKEGYEIRDEKKIRPSTEIMEEKLEKGEDFKETPRSARYLARDLLVVGLLTVICLLLLLISPLNKPPLRIIPSLIILFFLPGYSFIAALYLKLGDLGWLKQLLLTIISSIFLVLLVCILTNYFIPGIPQFNIFIIIAVITFILVTIAYIRRIRIYKEVLGESAEEGFEVGEEKTIRPSMEMEDEILEKPAEVEEKRWLFARYFLGDIALVVLFTVLCILFVLISPLNKTFIRIILGLLLILFLPGYCLIAALFPRKGDLDGVERVALSFGLSIAITPLIGLLLNYTPFGIRLEPILISLSVFTFLLAMVSYIRRLRLPEDERFQVRFRDYLGGVVGSFQRESKLDRILSVILVISIILSISMTVYIILTPKV